MSRPPKKPVPVRYGPGSYTPAPNGRGFDCVTVLHGKRERSRQPDESAARVWIDGTEAAAHAGRPPLTRAQLLDAQEAVALLPSSATLTAAARHYLSSVLCPLSSVPAVPFADAAARFLLERAHGAKPITLRKYRHLLALLRKSMPDGAALSDVTADRLNALLVEKTGRTRNNAIRHWQTFFRWSLASGLITADPSARLVKARPPEPPKGVLSVAQAAALMAAAAKDKPFMVPYLALALFAGIRPAELNRLRPAKIGALYVMLDGEVTKTADARHVRIRPNLAAWLARFPPDPARTITPRSAKHLYEAIRALCETTRADDDPAARIQKWPLDCMRHSFATYAYELEKDAAAVSAEMGHHGTDIFFTHYRALSNPGDGAKFFAIQPPEPTICQRTT